MCGPASNDARSAYFAPSPYIQVLAFGSYPLSSGALVSLRPSEASGSTISPKAWIIQSVRVVNVPITLYVAYSGSPGKFVSVDAVIRLLVSPYFDVRGSYKLHSNGNGTFVGSEFGSSVQYPVGRYKNKS